MFTQDFVLNGQGHGEVGETLASVRFDPGMMRPYFDKKGQACVTVNSGRFDPNSGAPIKQNVRIADLRNMGIDSPVFNATVLRKEEWLKLDERVTKAARYRLRAWADLMAACPVTGFDGMSKMLLEYETQSDPGSVTVDMDGITDPQTNDTPKNQLEGTPLPITQSAFWMSRRRLLISRNGGSPLDTTMAEAAGRRVAETVERTTIGNETGVTYGGASTYVGGYGRTSKVYGYTNFTSRLTKTNFTVPTGSNPEVTVADYLAARTQLFANKFYGPFMVYHSTDWDLYLDNDYARLGGNNASMTLRDRLKAIDGFTDVKRLDLMQGTAATDVGAPASSNLFTTLMVQMTPDVCEAINGMDITTIQWESHGGQKINFRVMCINVPRLKADYYGNCGILHGTTA